MFRHYIIILSSTEAHFRMKFCHLQLTTSIWELQNCITKTLDSIYKIQTIDINDLIILSTQVPPRPARTSIRKSRDENYTFYQHSKGLFCEESNYSYLFCVWLCLHYTPGYIVRCDIWYDIENYTGDTLYYAIH